MLTRAVVMIALFLWENLAGLDLEEGYRTEARLGRTRFFFLYIELF